MRGSIAVVLSVAACLANDDIPAPRIASITPDHGGPGTSVVVAGDAFCQQPDPGPDDEIDPLGCKLMGLLRFGVQPATTAFYTDTSITAIVPEAPPGRVRVHLDVGGRSSNGITFVVE